MTFAENLHASLAAILAISFLALGNDRSAEEEARLLRSKMRLATPTRAKGIRHTKAGGRRPYPSGGEF